MRTPIKATLLIFLLIEASCSVNYNKTMTKALKKALGSDFKKYQVFSYPTNNFGLITSFTNKFAPEEQLCAMASCLNLTIESDNDWLNLKELADVGNGEELTLSETAKRNIAVNAILPKIWKTLNISGDFAKNNTTTVNLSVGPGSVRFINKIKFENFIDSLPEENKYKQLYVKKELVVIVSDVIVKNLSVTVEVDDSTASKLNLELDNPGEAKKDDSKELDIAFQRVSKGKYTFNISKPIIILRLPKKQPQSQGNSSKSNFDDWTDVVAEKKINNQ